MSKQTELRKSLIALIKAAALREIPLVPTYGDLEKRGAGDISNPRVRFVLPYEDQHLLQMAINPKWKGWMRNAGGGIEEGETAQEAALREFEEEFGKKLKLEQLRHLGADPRDEFSTHQFYEVADHGLSPATYQASNDPDEIVQLVKALQSGDKYLGPDMSAWDKQAKEKEPWRVEKSDIHGKGIFALRDIPVGGHVAHSADLERDDVGLGQWELSEAGRYTNHSPDPNTVVISDGQKMTMAAAAPIEKGDEIKVSYFQVSSAMSPGTRLTYKGKPMRTVDASDLSKWAMDYGK